MPPTRFSAFDPRTENPNSLMQPFSFAAQDAAKLDAEVKRAQLAAANQQGMVSQAQVMPPWMQRSPGGSMTINVAEQLKRERAGLLNDERWVDVDAKNALTEGVKLNTSLDRQYAPDERAAKNKLSAATAEMYTPQAQASIRASDAGAGLAGAQTGQIQDMRMPLQQILQAGDLEMFLRLLNGGAAPAGGMPAPRKRRLVQSGNQFYEVDR